jgi:putative YphP/YqiW family bacilliredoxin
MDLDLLLAPMREELTGVGVQELRSADAVERALAQPGTALVAVNSVCGCAAARMRPALRLALSTATEKPDHLYSVFAGQDREATARAREYFTGIAPSSPSIALLRDGKLVWMLQRRDIENRDITDIAGDITLAFREFCSQPEAQRAS